MVLLIINLIVSSSDLLRCKIVPNFIWGDADSRNGKSNFIISILLLVIATLSICALSESEVVGSNSIILGIFFSSIAFC